MKHRVERGHRLLEDHADVAAAYVAHLRIGELQEITALEVDCAADDLARRVRDKSQDRHRADRLAAARLTNDRHRLTLCDIVRDAVDGLNNAAGGEELCAEFFDF